MSMERSKPGKMRSTLAQDVSTRLHSRACGASGPAECDPLAFGARKEGGDLPRRGTAREDVVRGHRHPKPHRNVHGSGNARRQGGRTLRGAHGRLHGILEHTVFHLGAGMATHGHFQLRRTFSGPCGGPGSGRGRGIVCVESGAIGRFGHDRFGGQPAAVPRHHWCSRSFPPVQKGALGDLSLAAFTWRWKTACAKPRRPSS